MAKPESRSWKRRAQPPVLRAARTKNSDDWRVAELYVERRGSRSIVGNVYKGKVDNVLPGLEAAFVDIGLEKNGFLHADDVVFPGVEVARRGRGARTKGKRITELLKPGPGDPGAGDQGPAEDQGAAPVDAALDRRSLPRLRAPGRGRRRVAPARGQGARPRAPRRRQGGPGRRRGDRSHRGAGSHARGVRARDQVPAQAARRAPAARPGGAGAGDGLPGGRPVGAGGARHLLGRVRAGDRRRREAAPPPRVVLQPNRARAARASRALHGRGPAVRALQRRGGHPVGAATAASTCPAADT